MLASGTSPICQVELWDRQTDKWAIRLTKQGRGPRKRERERESKVQRKSKAKKHTERET